MLKILAEYFQTIHREFYVIGATARDIVLHGVYAQNTRRMTKDLDIAIAIPNWDTFQEVASGICSIPGFQKSDRQKQRFYYEDKLILDIVPFGEIAGLNKNIFWPPEGTPSMSVAGFMEMTKEALTVTIDNEYNIWVASLPGIFILKLIAWKDRCNQHNKDAHDIALIIETYLEINMDRTVEVHNDIFTSANFTTFAAGAILMGRDMRKILSNNETLRLQCLTIINDEIKKEEYSLLINQVLETHSLIKYEDIFQGLTKIMDELNT
ncbi:MAG: nucleotidyl transferase AbiEii/AbiGii toxin family protein [Chitinophagaceae bacterium]|nr:nucleotidyl transferase AbiEii/AbiGii toxin family protein [Chitinophagaceae bacterium]